VDVSCHSNHLIDTCGTGGDSKGTFNISTTVAFVLAGAGLHVAKHGNRGVSSACGSADVLSELGIDIQLSPSTVARSIDEVGVGFLYAPLFHGAMKYAAQPRRDLGFRTVFNLLGPLTNPAGANYQLMGVYDKDLLQKVAETLAALGTKSAMVVHSLDGMDEISTAAPTMIAQVQQGAVNIYRLDPTSLGFAQVTTEAYRGGTPAENALFTLQILQGVHGAKRDVVLINAAAGLVVGGLAGDLQEGIKLAAASIDSGAALAKLEAVKAFKPVGEGLPLS
jgi:anthranilate phosphoribosyltransferase